MMGNANLPTQSRSDHRLDEFVDHFDLLGDWEQRYNYLIEIGEQLPNMPEHLRVEENQVKGCMSTVYISAYPDPNKPNAIQYHAFCDTSIIRGVIAILVQLAAGRTAAQIEQLDVDQLFERLQLHEHLSPNRHVGIYAIVELMKQQARELDGRVHSEQVNSS